MESLPSRQDKPAVSIFAITAGSEASWEPASNSPLQACLQISSVLALKWKADAKFGGFDRRIPRSTCLVNIFSNEVVVDCKLIPDQVIVIDPPVHTRNPSNHFPHPEREVIRISRQNR